MYAQALLDHKRDMQKNNSAQRRSASPSLQCVQALLGVVPPPFIWSLIRGRWSREPARDRALLTGSGAQEAPDSPGNTSCSQNWSPPAFIPEGLVTPQAVAEQQGVQLRFWGGDKG